MKIVAGRQYEACWWEGRRGKPSASEAKRIITPKGKICEGDGPLGYAFQLIADLYDPFYGKTDGYVSAAMKNGSMIEPEARAWYALRERCDVEEVCGCLSDDGLAWYSPDGLVGEHGLIECKRPEIKTHLQYLYDGVLPDEHKPQVHFGLALTGRAWLDFVSYNEIVGEHLIVRVEPDDYTMKVHEALTQFLELMASVRKHLNLPEPTGRHPELNDSDHPF